MKPEEQERLLDIIMLAIEARDKDWIKHIKKGFFSDT